MRNLKKVLSLVLCVAMLLSVMVMGTGAVTLTDSEDISPQYREAAEVLTGMGIINGYEDDSFKPQQSITRAEVAAMIYRVATGDVEDEKADINAGAKIFTDVDADDWYAGYVNYCGDAEYIKGFEDDSFRADENVTGYQVLAMILRAVGYDKNNEFTGTSWTINVASTAMQEGLLKNVDGSVDLSAPATRELVAEFIFRAIHPDVETVHYVPAAGIYRDEGSSLGEQVFDLAVVNDNDVWGRPATIWYAESSTYWNGAVKNDGYQSDKDDLYVTIEEEALATYTTAVKICDVADDLGIAEETFTTYTNGEVNDGTVKIDADATTDTIGAQGRLTEVYEDTIVYIDTFLAEVTGVTEVKYDADGHVAKDASLTLGVYANNGKNHNDAQSVTLTDDTNYTYAEGDMLLVNAVTDGADWHDAIATDGDKHVEFVGAAESFVGAQTYIQWNDNQHTVDGDVYNDALHFHLDAAGLNGDINYNWYLDQYDNLIGVTAIDRTNYAVLKDLTWITGTPGYAQATLVYMDGSEETVTVNAIDGDGTNPTTYWDASYDDSTPTMAASGVGFAGTAPNNDVARVSHDTAFNGLYDGFALYQVYTNDDGTVNLNGFDGNLNNGLIIDYATEATLDISASEILDKDGDVLAHVDAATQIVVNNGDGTYSTYTGTEALADFAGDSVEVFWSVAADGMNGAFTQNVYIKSYVAQADTGDHLFATESTYGHIVGDVEGNTNYYVMNVVVDGVERNIVTNETVRNTLLANIGKLFEVTFDEMPIEVGSALEPNYDYGYVELVTLVNEAKDGSDSSCDSHACNYLADIDVNDLGTNAIYDSMTDTSYNLTNATQIIYSDKAYEYADLEEAIVDGCGVWVVKADDSTSNNASAIYVGTKLDESVALTVRADAEDGTIAVDPDDPTKITFNSVKDVDEATLTYTADDANSVIVYGGDKTALHTVPVNVAAKDSQRTVTVWNEAGTDSETYTITLVWNVKSNDATLSSVKVDGTDVTIPAGTSTLNDDGRVFLGPTDSFTMVVTAKDSAATVKIGSGDTLDNAAKNLEVRNEVTVTDSTARNGGFVLIEVTAENGDVMYYVYDTSVEQ